jgi:hypothetical protein
VRNTNRQSGCGDSAHAPHRSVQTIEPAPSWPLVLVCFIAGHTAAGMWLFFDVSADGGILLPAPSPRRHVRKREPAGPNHRAEGQQCDGQHHQGDPGDPYLLGPASDLAETHIVLVWPVEPRSIPHPFQDSALGSGPATSEERSRVVRTSDDRRFRGRTGRSWYLPWSLDEGHPVERG